MNSRRQAALAAAAYLALAVAWTWPLATGLARDFPADFGDPLLNAWILAWDATHLGRGWWSANIFYPHPLALAYSEHLLPQALTIAPVYFATRNPILCYNVAFLSTFVLSGLGAFLLARELTKRGDAAFAAGLAFAFAPYRVASLPHLQVLSSAWMPFALYGFRRYFDTGRLRALAGGAAAWLLQNLSCGYYLFYFTPVVVAYLTWELTVRRASSRTVLTVAGTCGVVAAATLPFLLPYLEVRRLGFQPRTLAEITRFSADTFAYFTADPNVRVWGPIARAWNQPEGALFPGLTIVVLAAFAVARALSLLPWTVVLLSLFAVRIPVVKMTSVWRTLLVCAMTSAAILGVSRAERRRVLSLMTSPVGLFSAVAIFAFAMSLGPEVHAHGRVVADGVLYGLAYRFVPGFDGLRVPARFGMIAAFALSTLTAFAIRGRTVAIAAAALILAESAPVPIPINQNDTNYKQPYLAALPDRVRLEERQLLDDFLARLPPSTVIAELPLGEPAFDVRYMFASTRHWKRLVNGYSGGVPPDYERLAEALQDVLAPHSPADDRAWDSLASTGARTVVVHEAFYTSGRGAAMTAWLRLHGAREMAAFGSDRVLDLK